MPIDSVRCQSVAWKILATCLHCIVHDDLIFIHTNKDCKSGILQAVHGYPTCMAVFFGSWLCQMMHAFISLYVKVNKIAETVVIKNHVRYSKTFTHSENHRLLWSVSSWNYYTVLMWRRQLYNDHNINLILSSVGVKTECCDIIGELCFQQGGAIAHKWYIN